MSNLEKADEKTPPPPARPLLTAFVWRLVAAQYEVEFENVLIERMCFDPRRRNPNQPAVLFDQALAG
jgi:hypothetical protein